jgi:hypothetical protein
MAVCLIIRLKDEKIHASSFMLWPFFLINKKSKERFHYILRR